MNFGTIQTRPLGVQFYFELNGGGLSGLSWPKKISAGPLASAPIKKRRVRLPLGPSLYGHSPLTHVCVHAWLHLQIGLSGISPSPLLLFRRCLVDQRGLEALASLAGQERGVFTPGHSTAPPRHLLFQAPWSSILFRIERRGCFRVAKIFLGGFNFKRPTEGPRGSQREPERAEPYSICVEELNRGSQFVERN